MAQISVADLISRNKQYAATHEPIDTFAEKAATGGPKPQIMMIGCADPRVPLEKIFNIDIGEVIVLRTIAGHPHHVMNDIVGLDALLGMTDLILVHHMDCGATHFTDEKLRAGLKSIFPTQKVIDDMDFGEITDSVEENLKTDLQFLKDSPLIRDELKKNLHGYVYNIKTGLAEKVDF